MVGYQDILRFFINVFKKYIYRDYSGWITIIFVALHWFLYEKAIDEREKFIKVFVSILYTAETVDICKIESQSISDKCTRADIGKFREEVKKGSFMFKFFVNFSNNYILTLKTDSDETIGCFKLSDTKAGGKIFYIWVDNEEAGCKAESRYIINFVRIENAL